MTRDKPSNARATKLWILVGIVPLVGAIAAMLYVLGSNNKNKAYTLLFLVPIIGPIIAYVLTSDKDKYISTMSQWLFVGQILWVVIGGLLKAAL